MSSLSEIPLTRYGVPDMRYNVSKEWILEQAIQYPIDVPSWVPIDIFGNPDMSTTAVRRFFEHRKAFETTRARQDESGLEVPQSTLLRPSIATHTANVNGSVSAQQRSPNSETSGKIPSEEMQDILKYIHEGRNNRKHVDARLDITDNGIDEQYQTMKRILHALNGISASITKLDTKIQGSRMSEDLEVNFEKPVGVSEPRELSAILEAVDSLKGKLSSTNEAIKILSEEMTALVDTVKTKKGPKNWCCVIT